MLKSGVSDVCLLVVIYANVYLLMVIHANVYGNSC